MDNDFEIKIIGEKIVEGDFSELLKDGAVYLMIEADIKRWDWKEYHRAAHCVEIPSDSLDLLRKDAFENFKKILSQAETEPE